MANRVIRPTCQMSAPPDSVLRCQSSAPFGPHGPAERGILSHLTSLLTRRRRRRRLSPPSPNTPPFVRESRGLGGDKWWRLWCKVIPSKTSDLVCIL
uniref:Uncharacterized protein n=1 Tax=Oryza punctata TaxID=4537 RepID=A0A0E0KU73_ORYPU